MGGSLDPSIRLQDISMYKTILFIVGIFKLGYIFYCEFV